MVVKMVIMMLIGHFMDKEFEEYHNSLRDLSEVLETMISQQKTTVTNLIQVKTIIEGAINEDKED